MANYCSFVCELLAEEERLFLSSQNQACNWSVYFRATTGSKVR